VIQSQPHVIYVEPRRSVLHGPLTILMVLWAIALPAVVAVLTAFGPIGWIVGVGLAIVLAVPWLIGLFVLWFLRRLA
jgi:hypothetical protein